ncbi:CUB domain-containing protein [Caerostris extrusa]|uniref:CUB domain-containing protein n=1 Tax=Caerostris extrusa TaxID=172846 RepID=A0AAV4YB35_CAEEX|nr:CUB domain-containing protein [Caerostris extrusa]
MICLTHIFRSSCLNSPDVIMVYDGSNKSAPIIGHLCNTNTFVEIVSSASDLFIEFLSRSHFPGQGFKASYLFDSKPQPRHQRYRRALHG